jgi:hypothetical protein
MACKYVKDFQFDKSFGYTGSSGAQAGAKMGPGPVSNSDARRAAQAIANANKGTQTEGDVIRDRTHRIVDDTEPSASEISRMRQAREYMKEDKATSEAAKREMGFKRGGLKVTEKATGETYPSRKAMVKHEKTETPRMQREEVIQKQVVRGPAMAAGRDPRIPMFKCGGKAKK